MIGEKQKPVAFDVWTRERINGDAMRVVRNSFAGRIEASFFDFLHCIGVAPADRLMWLRHARAAPIMVRIVALGEAIEPLIEIDSLRCFVEMYAAPSHQRGAVLRRLRQIEERRGNG
ncbi:hypothetical protein [Rhodoblastus sp.]|uniref:hypothetical protein n=1 Tax=Rhodoblastus sp. TaxID=1962975 RepID=UPI00260D8255|nr:hypothetical protein [Rhodoblastus sp.]